MNDTLRLKLYNNFNEDISINILEEIEIDLKKSYNYNKQKILNIIENNISIGKNGSKYFKSYGAIWALKGKTENGEDYFDICETSSVCDEMITYLQYLTLAKRDVRKNIYKNFKRNVYTRYKAQQIYKSLTRSKKIYFVLLERNDNKNSRLENEIKYACKLKALWWSPNPKQMKYLQNSEYFQ